MRDEKLKRECERLDIIIARERGELIPREEAESEFRKAMMLLRKAADDWKAHETAKAPDDADLIQRLHTDFLKRMLSAEI